MKRQSLSGNAKRCSFERWILGGLGCHRRRSRRCACASTSPRRCQIGSSTPSSRPPPPLSPPPTHQRSHHYCRHHRNVTASSSQPTSTPRPPPAYACCYRWKPLLVDWRTRPSVQGESDRLLMRREPPLQFK
jgi:hypothetical protein